MKWEFGLLQYQLFWVSVSDQNQNSGFGRTLLQWDLNLQPLGQDLNALPTELQGQSISTRKISKIMQDFCNYVTNLCQTRGCVAQVVIYSRDQKQLCIYSIFSKPVLILDFNSIASHILIEYGFIGIFGPQSKKRTLYSVKHTVRPNDCKIIFATKKNLQNLIFLLKRKSVG